MTNDVIMRVYPEVSEELKRCLFNSSILLDLLSLFRRKREQHFERYPFASHEIAWEIGILELRYRLMKYRWHYQRRAFRRACREVGVIIHMIEDFYRCSNVFDLSPDDAAEVLNRLIALDEYPQLEGEPLVIASKSLLQLFGLQQDGYTYQQAAHRNPSSEQLDQIAAGVKRFFDHYGIIV